MTTTTMTNPTTTPGPLVGKTVVIDPGHNGMNWAHQDQIARLVDIGNGTKACNTTGTSTRSGYTEAELNWVIAQLVVPRLEELGATVVLTRQDNDGWGPCIDERAAIGNRNQADAVISIHADGGPDDGRGFHVIRPADIVALTDDIYDTSTRLAVAVHDAYLRTGMPVADYIGDDGYSERADLGGLNLSDVPAVFLETGNMRNDTDAALLTDPAFQDAAADAITTALVRFLTG
jgi:N-acetylmuramoyl-L-alanine amidase